MARPGISCGDLGPKLGFNHKNNGWCQFSKVRIPRDQLLMKYVKVTKEGEFSVKGDLRVLYAAMLDWRVFIPFGAGKLLQQSCLIALRYSVVRRQFRNTEGSKLETKLLDY